MFVVFPNRSSARIPEYNTLVKRVLLSRLIFLYPINHMIPNEIFLLNASEMLGGRETVHLQRS